MNEKKLLRIVLGLLVAVFIHNLFLNYKLLQIKKATLNGTSLAVDIVDYTIEAVDYASKAADYANDAADYARDAAYYASEAAENSYGNICVYCP